MKIQLSRRAFTGVALNLACMTAFSQGAAPAAAYPAQPIKIIVPYPAGGFADMLARMIGQKLSDTWRQPVLVDNRPGAGATIGTDAVAKAPPDGYTVLLAITALIQTPLTMAKVPYDPVKDFQPISRLVTAGTVFSVPVSLPVSSLKEFIAYAKANPGKVSYGTFGNGSTAHLHGSLLNRQAGIDMVQIPYKGVAPLLTDLLGGQLTAAFTDLATIKEQLKSFKVLAVSGTQRLKQLPDAPTFTELGFSSFDRVGWVGLFMPAGTPMPIVNKFSSEVARIIRLPEVAARLSDLGYLTDGNTSQEFSRIVQGDAMFYPRIYKDMNIKTE